MITSHNATYRDQSARSGNRNCFRQAVFRYCDTMAFKWQSLLRRLGGNDDSMPAVSLVLLEREWQPISDETLLEYAHTVYRAAKPKGGIEILNKRTPESRVLRVENFFFAFHQAQHRYTGPPPGRAEAVQQAWGEHSCWSSLDWFFPDLADRDKPGARRLLLPLVELLWSSRTAGLFFPDCGVTAPAMGGFSDSILWTARNGVALHELIAPPASAQSAEKQQIEHLPPR